MEIPLARLVAHLVGLASEAMEAQSPRGHDGMDRSSDRKRVHRR